jgi:2-polyprenyl-6-methoxyphenol hydroxylase-like FAD-dependent oxidoreductase
VTNGGVLVVGGGPAGCAAATLLARWGHTVTLVTKPSSDTAPLGESIPPSTRKLFDLLGITSRLDAPDFIRSTGNTVWWGSSVPRLELFDGGEHGWQVTTASLEAVLRAMAVESGAHVEVTRIEAGRIDARAAAFVLDCTGRAGVLARARRLRTDDATFVTVAMVGSWHADAFDVPEPTHTIIESYDGGWAWSVPQSPTERFVAVMVDPRVSSLARDRASRQVYLAEIEKTTQFRRILQHASLVDGPRGWNASMYHATRYVDDNVMLVGDAGSFIDPLSSAGVKKALASAWLAAVATHTSLLKPHMRSVALEFFEGREREVYGAFRRLTESYWRDAASGHRHPFWTDRGGEPETTQDDDRVAVEFERIRSAPELRLSADPSARVAERPAVSGAEIVFERCLTREGSAREVRYAYGVDLLGLVELAPTYSSVPELFAAYNLRHAPVGLPAFLAALAAAIAQQWLRWCDTY